MSLLLPKYFLSCSFLQAWSGQRWSHQMVVLFTRGHQTWNPLGKLMDHVLVVGSQNLMKEEDLERD
jgi:hypothetical protein